MNTFTQQFQRIYSVKRWTFEHFFCIFVYFVIFALPFYFCFASKNFWFDEQYSLMEVNYQYTGYYAVQVNYIAANGSTATKQIAVLPSSNIASLTNLEFSIDDNQTTTTFNFEIMGLSSQRVLSTNILVFYDVQVPALDKVASSSYAVSVLDNVNNAQVAGKLSLQVSTAFNALTSLSTSTINRPAYFDQNYQSPSSFQSLMDAHLQNPYKLQSQTYIQSIPRSTITDPRTITLKLAKNRQIVLPYYPSILQTFKLKFSIYFGMLILSYLIFNNLMLQLVKDEALQCNQKDEIPPSIINNN